MDHPGPRLLGTRGQIRLQFESVEPGTGQRIKAPLMLSDRLQQLRGGFVVEFLKLGLNLRIEKHRVGGSDEGTQFSDPDLITEHRLVGVEHVEKRLGSQQVQLT